MHRLMRLVVLSFLFVACAKPAPRLRVATATPAQLQEARAQKEVWYYFQKGDVIPFAPMFFGAGEGAAQAPVAVQARQDFWLVFRKSVPVSLSLDGKRKMMETGATLLLVTPSSAYPGGQLNWVIFIGNPADAEGAFDALLKSAK